MGVTEDFRRTFCRTIQKDNIMFVLLWHVLHLILRVIFLAREVLHAIESYLITNGFVTSYQDLNLDRVKYLAIVVESDEARHIAEVIKLLGWLSAIGIKKVCLYDREGVLKKSKDVIMERFFSPTNEDSKIDPSLHETQKQIEFVSISDGKEAVAKAANVLFNKYYLDGDTEKPFFTEAELSTALESLEPDPDLLLIYGPARCHLGFPAWRIRYTEIVHMGPLKHKKYGVILKAIHKYTKVKQNYGS